MTEEPESMELVCIISTAKDFPEFTAAKAEQMGNFTAVIQESTDNSSVVNTEELTDCITKIMRYLWQTFVLFFL